MTQHLSIIVPGIAGSKLYCDCDLSGLRPNYRLYPRKRWFFNSAIDKHLYECTNVKTKPLKTFWTISIYEKCIKKLSSCVSNKVEIFSYDWRRDPVKIAKDFLSFLKICELSRYDNIRLIGHSLGGLIIRIVLEYIDGLVELPISCDQITVFQCGTPMYGSENIHDFNYGFELAAILASTGQMYSSCPAQKISKRDIKKVKPFLFSVQDLQKIIENTSPSLMYLLPTPMIKSINKLLQTGQLNIKPQHNFGMVYNVHKKLSKLQFPVKYNFFFNISHHKIETVYIPFTTNDIFTKISVHDIKPGNKKKECGIHLKRLLKSDGLVVPYSGQNVPYNCSIYVDESVKCSHAYLMNSNELLRIIMNTHNNNFDYLGMISPEGSLPSYDDIYN